MSCGGVSDANVKERSLARSAGLIEARTKMLLDAMPPAK